MVMENVQERFVFLKFSCIVLVFCQLTNSSSNNIIITIKKMRTKLTNFDMQKLGFDVSLVFVAFQ